MNAEKSNAGDKNYIMKSAVDSIEANRLTADYYKLKPRDPANQKSFERFAKKQEPD